MFSLVFGIHNYRSKRPAFLRRDCLITLQFSFQEKRTQYLPPYVLPTHDPLHPTQLYLPPFSMISTNNSKISMCWCPRTFQHPDLGVKAFKTKICFALAACVGRDKDVVYNYANVILCISMHGQCATERSGTELCGSEHIFFEYQF